MKPLVENAQFMVKTWVSGLESRATTSSSERTVKPVASYTLLLSLSILPNLEKIHKWNSLPMIPASRTLKSWQHRRGTYPRTFLRVVHFHGKERMQMRATDKTYPGDIMILLETFQHLKQCFSSSSVGAADAASCCLCSPLKPRPVFAGLIP